MKKFILVLLILSGISTGKNIYLISNTTKEKAIIASNNTTKSDDEYDIDVPIPTSVDTLYEI